MWMRTMLLSLVACSLLFAADKQPTKPADPSKALSKAEGKAEKADPRKADPAVIDPNLPNVLIIGDSISMGYTLPTRKRLEGKANVFRAKANCGPTTRGLANLDEWLGDRKWDLIHFNFGIHDAVVVDAKGGALKAGQPDTGLRRTPIDQYEANLRTIVERLKKTGAVLVFGTTTPLSDGIPHIRNGDELRYNEVAVKVMKEAGVRINDLHGWISPHLKTVQPPANVHYTPEGYEKLAEQVARGIEAGLQSRHKP